MDVQEILQVLLERADSGEHYEFRLITTWRDYFETRYSMRSVASVVRILTKAKRRTFKKYCKEVRAGEASFIKLLACNTLQSAIKFYIDEHNILFDMLEEFETYAARGKFLDPILFGERLEQDLWDHRKDI